MHSLHPLHGARLEQVRLATTRPPASSRAGVETDDRETIWVVVVFHRIRAIQLLLKEAIGHVT